jgi:hypothetical protein
MERAQGPGDVDPPDDQCEQEPADSSEEYPGGGVDPPDGAGGGGNTVDSDF